MLRIEYRASDRRALVRWERADEATTWLPTIRRLIVDCSNDAVQEDGWSLSLPWWSFAAIRAELLQLFKGYGLQLGVHIAVSSDALTLLRQSRRSVAGYEAARTATIVPEKMLLDRLAALGFSRELSKHQIRNVGRLAAMPAGATFSVPGAGKTTEALACHLFRAEPTDRLLVVAPKNAFPAWDEELQACMPHLDEKFVRLRGKDNIAGLLQAEPRFAIITYQQLTRVRDIVAAYCAKGRIHVYLDESHRIKSGTGGQQARAVLTLAHLPVGKLIMSGTPMPQATDDLVPQFSFLYPEIPSTALNVVGMMRPVYVRTTKAELALPPITRNVVSLPMAPLQGELYKLLRSEVARQAIATMSQRNRHALRALGRSVARLLMFVSNPALLASDVALGNPEMLAGVLAEGDGPKLRYILARARSLARDGKKVLIWTSFRRNVEYLAERLADLGAVYIHGGVDAGDDEDDETREGKVRLFHDDPAVQVMVANPAAAGEGMSLHRICHHALYLDRTFNAAHYLQSEDRIHRFGLAAGQETFVEIVECQSTVDETVRARLGFKIGQMAAALDDPSLRPDPVPLDPTDIEDYEDYSTGLSLEDVAALIKDLGQGV